MEENIPHSNLEQWPRDVSPPIIGPQQLTHDESLYDSWISVSPFRGDVLSAESSMHSSAAVSPVNTLSPMPCRGEIAPLSLGPAPYRSLPIGPTPSPGAGEVRVDANDSSDHHQAQAVPESEVPRHGHGGDEQQRLQRQQQTPPPSDAFAVEDELDSTSSSEVLVGLSMLFAEPDKYALRDEAEAEVEEGQTRELLVRTVAVSTEAVCNEHLDGSFVGISPDEAGITQDGLAPPVSADGFIAPISVHGSPLRLPPHHGQATARTRCTDRPATPSQAGAEPGPPSTHPGITRQWGEPFGVLTVHTRRRRSHRCTLCHRTEHEERRLSVEPATASGIGAPTMLRSSSSPLAFTPSSPPEHCRLCLQPLAPEPSQAFRRRACVQKRRSVALPLIVTALLSTHLLAAAVGYFLSSSGRSSYLAATATATASSTAMAFAQTLFDIPDQILVYDLYV